MNENHDTIDNSSKGNKYKWILLSLDIIVLTFVIVSYFLKKPNVREEEITKPSIQSFKIFIYNFPNNINFLVEDSQIMVLKGSNYTARVNVIGDPNNFIFRYNEIIKEELDTSHNITNTKEEEISNVNFLIFEYEDNIERGMICYFRTLTNPAYTYEIRLNNTDNSYNTSALTEISSNLLKGTYSDELSMKYVVYYIEMEDFGISSNYKELIGQVG